MNIFKLHCPAQFCVSLAYALLVYYYFLTYSSSSNIKKISKFLKYLLKRIVKEISSEKFTNKSEKYVFKRE